jgi:hypothetical protein
MLWFFYDLDNKILLLTAGSLVVFNLWGDIIGHSELDNCLEIRFFKTATPALQKLTTAISLSLLVLYLPQINGSNLFVSQQTFQSFYDWVADSVNSFYPEINFSSSFGSFAQSLVKSELQNNKDFKNLPPGEQGSVIQQSVNKVADSFSKTLGTPVSSDEPLSQVFYNFIVKTMGDLRERFQSWFLVGWLLVVFLIIRGLGTIFYWIIALLSFVVYQLLMAFGFIHILGESRTHEIIEF